MFHKFKLVILKQNFDPGIIGFFINPFYFARHSLAKHIKLLSSEITGKVLDIGCGTKPYKEFFNYSDYTGMEIDTPDTRKNSKVDVFYDGKTFPFEDGEFDSIVINQVLEHVFTPDEFLAETRRVLKPGGKLLLTVPFIWDEHEQPFDYARYSSFGLKYLLEKNGFKVTRQYKSLDNFRLFFQLLNAYFYKKIDFHNKYINFIMITIVTSINNLIGVPVSMILPRNKDLYLDNIILAQKSGDTK